MREMIWILHKIQKEFTSAILKITTEGLLQFILIKTECQSILHATQDRPTFLIDKKTVMEDTAKFQTI